MITLLTVTLLTLFILQHLKHKTQLKQATDDGVLMGIDLVHSMQDTLEEYEKEIETFNKEQNRIKNKKKHAEQSLKSYYKRKNEKSVVTVKECPEIESTFNTNK